MKSGDIRLEASQRLIEMLSNIEHQISFALLDRIRNKEYDRISYLDFGNENDNVSYIINNKFMELVRANEVSWKELVWTDKRTNLKIGKLIKMMFEDHFPVNQPKDCPAPRTRNDIESFVNMFKAEREKNVNYARFEVVTGEDIRFWYDHQNYSRFAHQETPLGKSCMRYTESGKFLGMYTSNTDVFSMLILKDDAGKLKGRAILWNLEVPSKRIFMDRIYTVNDFDIEIFKNYAKEQGWLYRTEQRYGWFNKIADPTTNSVYEYRDMLLQVTLNKHPERHYEYYPYLDSLSIYNKETHVLSNNGDLRTTTGHIILTDYQGRYHSEVDDRPRVFSTFYNENILEDEAVYVDIDETWVYRGDEVYVHNTGERKAYNKSPKIVCSNVLGNTKYFLVDEAIWSEYMDTFIYKNSARTAYLEDKEVIIHYKLIGVEFEESNGRIFYSNEVRETYLKNRKAKQKKSMGDSYGSYYRAPRTDRGQYDVEDGGVEPSETDLEQTIDPRRLRSTLTSSSEALHQMYETYSVSHNSLYGSLTGSRSLGHITMPGGQTMADIFETPRQVENDESPRQVANDESTRQVTNDESPRQVVNDEPVVQRRNVSYDGYDAYDFQPRQVEEDIHIIDSEEGNELTDELRDLFADESNFTNNYDYHPFRVRRRN